jgi:uncharacterized protein HemX
MTEQSVKPNRRKKVLVFFALTVILIIAITLGGYFWPRFSKAAMSFLKEHSSATSATTIVSLQDSLTQKQVIIQELQNEMQKQEVAKAKAKVQAQAMDWKPIAVGHLVRMADLTLNTTGDVKTALSFLVAAKKYTTDPETLAINRALNKDIIRLQAVPKVNVEDIVFKIDTISEKISALAITPTHLTVLPGVPKKVGKQQPKPVLKRFLISAVQALKDIVIIRHQDIEPILPPEQTITLRFNVQAKLLQAELAVMQRQDKLYQAYLAQVVGLINKYFVLNSATTNSVLRMLEGLQQINLQPKLPELESLVAIKNFAEVDNVPAKKPAQPKVPQPQGAELL